MLLKDWSAPLSSWTFRRRSSPRRVGIECIPACAPCTCVRQESPPPAHGNESAQLGNERPQQWHVGERGFLRSPVTEDIPRTESRTARGTWWDHRQTSRGLQQTSSALQTCTSQRARNKLPLPLRQECSLNTTHLTYVTERSEKLYHLFSMQPIRCHHGKLTRPQGATSQSLQGPGVWCGVAVKTSFHAWQGRGPQLPHPMNNKRVWWVSWGENKTPTPLLPHPFCHNASGDGQNYGPFWTLPPKVPLLKGDTKTKQKTYGHGSKSRTPSEHPNLH